PVDGGRRRSQALEWVPVLAGPLAIGANLQVSYMLVSPACLASTRLIIGAVHLTSLLIVLGGALVGWRQWTSVGRGWPGEEPGVVERGRFLALLGLLFSALSLLAVLAQTVPTFILSPCQ